MARKILLIILIIILLFSCNACWSKKEPKELAALLSVVYDIDEQGEFPIILEILNTKSQGSQETTKQTSTKLIKLYDKTIPEGIRDTLVTIDKTLYGSHNKARIFTERMAKNGLNDIMDFFLRDHLADERPIMLIVKNKDPLLLYEADTGLSNSLGTYIDSIFRTREEFSEYSVFLNTLEFMKALYCQGRQPVMGVVEAIIDETYEPPASREDQESISKYILVFNGLAVFKGDKLIGYLDKYQTRVYRALTSQIKSAYVSIPMEDGYVVGNCLKTKTDIKTSISNGKANVNISIKKEIMLAQNMTKYDVGDIKEIKIIEKAINKFIAEDIRNTVSYVQTEYKSDIFGFGNWLFKQHPKEWRKVRDKWDDEYFPTANINIAVKSIVKFGGESRERFGEKVGEEI